MNPTINHTDNNPAAVTPSYWLPDYQTAFGDQGIVVLSWWFGSLFSEQVREQHGSYPFLALTSEAGSGKTAMVQFLWKLLDREDDSFNPSACSIAGLTRKMADVSNMPVVFNEFEDRFDLDRFKFCYHGDLEQVVGNTKDNSVHKPGFRGGLMIMRSEPVVASEAFMLRTCSLTLDRSRHSLAGKSAENRLHVLGINEVSGFLLNSVSKAEAVMAQFNESFKTHRITLQRHPKIKLQRIVDNHAMLMAFTDCLRLVLPISDATIADAHKTLLDMAQN